MEKVEILLPTIEELSKIASDILDKVKPELTAHEQAFFYAGFTECVK